MTVYHGFLFIYSIYCVASTSLQGTWYINDEGYPLQTFTTLQRSILIIQQNQNQQSACDGLNATFLDTSLEEYTVSITLCAIAETFFMNDTYSLNFCIPNYKCYESLIYSGAIMKGHQCTNINYNNCSQNKASTLLPFSGWNRGYFDTDFLLRSSHNTPKDFLLTIYPINNKTNDGSVSLSHVRFDYNSTSNQYIGRYKIFHENNQHNTYGGEQLEYDIKIITYTESFIEFVVSTDESVVQHFMLDLEYVQTKNNQTILLRNLTGNYIVSRMPASYGNVTGIRWNIFNPGLIAHDNITEFIEWQTKTKAFLTFLMMNGDPHYVSVKQHITQVPVSHSCSGLHRDDNCDAHSQSYDVYNVTLNFQIPNYYNPTKPFLRQVHCYVSIPIDASYETSNAFVLAVNGHTGSAYQMLFTPNATHDWYADAFARRKYITLSVDISHRNVTPIYHDKYNYGDDPMHDNHAHPAIMDYNHGPSFSDWEETGERIWDAIHATKWFMSKNGYFDKMQLNVDPNRIYVTGHSMGGEVTTYLGALFSADVFKGGVIPGGFSPDFDVYVHHGNHPCWRWLNANIREHIDTAVLHALITPNLLIVETGQKDLTYSNHDPSFSADKQVLRRTREYGYTFLDDTQFGRRSPFALNIFHYLHYDTHHYHVGDIDDNNVNLTHLYVQLSHQLEPQFTGDLQWELIANTTALQCPKNESIQFNLFDLLQYYQENVNT